MRSCGLPGLWIEEWNPRSQGVGSARHLWVSAYHDREGSPGIDAPSTMCLGESRLTVMGSFGAANCDEGRRLGARETMAGADLPRCGEDAHGCLPFSSAPVLCAPAPDFERGDSREQADFPAE